MNAYPGSACGQGIDKPHVNAASIAGPHDTRWTSIAPIYTCLGGNVGQIQLQRKLVHGSEFPPSFPVSNHLRAGYDREQWEDQRYTYFSAEPQPWPIYDWRCTHRRTMKREEPKGERAERAWFCHGRGTSVGCVGCVGCVSMGISAWELDEPLGLFLTETGAPRVSDLERRSAPRSRWHVVGLCVQAEKLFLGIGMKWLVLQVPPMSSRLFLTH
jgi:hypothetical protein